jgi:hypothetical protein
VLAVCAAVSVLSGCREPLKRDECEKLIDKYIELLTVHGATAPLGDEVLRRQAEARLRYGDQPEFLGCAEHVSRSDYDCAMQSATPERFEQCLL